MEFKELNAAHVRSVRGFPFKGGHYYSMCIAGVNVYLCSDRPQQVRIGTYHTEQVIEDAELFTHFYKIAKKAVGSKA